MTSKAYSYGRQVIDEADIRAVVEALQSDWLTQGPAVKQFEDALCAKLQAGHATAVSSGTAGLHLIGLALGWKKDDIVITSPITFLASANCALYVGATPDFVDIEPDYYTIDVNKLEEKIKLYRSKGKAVKAVVAVDFAGHPCDWSALKTVAEKYQFQLVNDHCHAVGSTYRQNSGFAVQYADAVNLSFHPVKHITTGEGGAILTNRNELDQKVKILRSHGMTKDEQFLQSNDGPWYYEMVELGYNYRITDFQCALGISQLGKLERFVLCRQEIARFYQRYFETDPRLIVPRVRSDSTHAYHLYPLQIDFKETGQTREEVFRALKAKGIFPQVHYIPIHLQPYYRKRFGFKNGDFPVAEEFYKREISMPMYPSLEEDDIEYICQTLFSIMKKKT